MFCVRRRAVDAGLPGDDPVTPGVHDRQGHLDRRRRVEPLGDGLGSRARHRVVGTRHRGEPGSAHDRGAVGDHAAHGVGMPPRHLASDHAAEAPADQGDRGSALVGQLENSTREPFGVTAGITRVGPEAPALRVVPEVAEIGAQRSSRDLRSLPTGDVHHDVPVTPRSGEEARQGSGDPERSQAGTELEQRGTARRGTRRAAQPADVRLVAGAGEQAGGGQGGAAGLGVVARHVMTVRSAPDR